MYRYIIRVCLPFILIVGWYDEAVKSGMGNFFRDGYEKSVRENIEKKRRKRKKVEIK